MAEFFASLTGFDYFILLIVGISALIGLKRGFVTEVLALLAWAGAIGVTVFGYGVTLDLVEDRVRPEWVAEVLTAFMLFFVSLVALKMLAKFIGNLVKQSPFGALDVSLGAVLGLLRGILVIAAAYLFFNIWVPQSSQPQWIKGARFQGLAAYSAEMLAVLGADLFERVKEDEDAQKLLDKARANMPADIDLELTEEQIGYARELRDKLKDELEERFSDEKEEEDDPPRDDDQGR